MRLLLFIITLIIIFSSELESINKNSNQLDIKYFYFDGDFCNLENWRGFYLKNIIQTDNYNSKEISKMINNLKSNFELTNVIITWTDDFINKYNNQNIINRKVDLIKIKGISFCFNYNKEYNYRVIICFKSLLIQNYVVNINKGKDGYYNTNADKLLTYIQNTTMDKSSIIIQGLEHKPIRLPTNNNN